MITNYKSILLGIGILFGSSIFCLGQGTNYGTGSGTKGSAFAYFGNDAGFSSDFGSMYNTFIGFWSGKNSTGNYNTFLGSQAGLSNSNGEGNTYIGFRSAGGPTVANVSTGKNNVFVGRESGFSITTAENNVFIGVNSGFNTTSAIDNVFMGYNSGYRNSTGENNTFLGNHSGFFNRTGTENTYIGFLANGFPDLINANVIGSRAFAFVDSCVILGNHANVGIGTPAPTYQLHLTRDDAGKPGSNVWTVISDKRLKKDITPFQEGLSTITKINPVWFSYNGQAGTPTDKKYVGVIAQDMQQIAPYTVGKYVYIDSTKREEYLDYDGNAITYMLINSVKELNQLSDKQNQLIEKQNQRIEKQNQRIAELEQKLGIQNGSSSSVSSSTSTSIAQVELYQNVPNPFSEKTEIACYLTDQVQSASILIFDMNGKKLKSIPVSGKGKVTVTIDAKELSSGAGMYIYSLIVDGKEIDIKRMIIG